MKYPISDVLKQYDKKYRSVDADVLNSGSFERMVRLGINVSISQTIYDEYPLNLDFNCFDINLDADMEKIKMLGCLFYDGNDKTDSVFVGSKKDISAIDFGGYLKKFEEFSTSVKQGIDLSLSFPYEFLVKDNDNCDLISPSLLYVKYNPVVDLDRVYVKMVLKESFSALLDISKEIDIILNVLDSDDSVQSDEM